MNTMTNAEINFFQSVPTRLYGIERDQDMIASELHLLNEKLDALIALLAEKS